MAERRPSYMPPPLEYQVVIRNPADRPTPIQQDEFGNVTEVAWGHKVWAGRTDRTPYTITEDGVPVHLGITIWTIRARPNVAGDVEVVYKDRVYVSQGVPVERGGPAWGRRERYLLITTRLRTA